MDHSRVDISRSSISCGVRQISRLSDEAEENLFAIANEFYHPAHGAAPAFCVWSNLDGKEGNSVNGGEGTNGHRLSKAIARLGFGEVIKTAPAVNPSTGSVISVWTWTVQHERFKSWYKDRKIEKLKAR